MGLFVWLLSGDPRVSENWTELTLQQAGAWSTVQYSLVAVLLTPTFAAPHPYTYATSQSYAVPSWSGTTFFSLTLRPRAMPVPGAAPQSYTYATSQSYEVPWSRATFLYLRYVPELCPTLEPRHILILTPRPRATPQPGAMPHSYTYVMSQSYTAPWSCAIFLYLLHVPELGCTQDPRHILIITPELLCTLELCHTPRTKEYSSNRNKPKQDLFQLCFGLFRETKN